MAKSQPKEKEKEESICIGSVDPRQASHETRFPRRWARCPVFELGQQALVCMSRNRIISSGAERESSASPLLLPPSVISRGGSRRVEIVRRLLVWQVPLQPPEERRGSSRPGGRFIVAEYKPLFEISWNAYDFASERAFNVGREREREHKARFRGELRLNVLACPLAPSQTSRLGLNFDSELRKSLFSFGGRRL